MTVEFKLPELGENITSGTVAKVLVAVGDAVSVNQPVLEVETDKAVAEIPSSVAGTVIEVRVKEGQSVSAGDVVLVFDETGKTAEEPAAAPPVSRAEAVPAAAPPPPAATPPPRAPAPAAPATRPASGPVLASPSVRRLARELGVDINAVPSARHCASTADPGGRVTAQDLQRVAQGQVATPPAPASTPESASSVTKADLEESRDAYGPVAFAPMNTIRKKTAEHMAYGWSTIPHVTHFEDADVTELEALRKKHAKAAESQGGRLTTICFILKALVEAFKRFPKFNASLDVEQGRLILKRYYHIGVAVDTPNGLLVPVLRDVDRKSLLDIAIELPRIAEKARARKLALEEMQGGTFTVTNLGGLGGRGFTPIINAPEAAILGVSRSRVEPVYREGTWVPRTMLPLGLSYDHRVNDGAGAARFMRWLADALEQPWTMFLGF